MTTRERDIVYAECDVWGEDRVQVYVDANPEDSERTYRLEWLLQKARAAKSDPEWDSVPHDFRNALKASWVNGMPPMASALYGRWWQLETWLGTHESHRRYPTSQARGSAIRN
jgi:hypothetical protein